MVLIETMLFIESHTSLDWLDMDGLIFATLALCAPASIASACAAGGGLSRTQQGTVQ